MRPGSVSDTIDTAANNMTWSALAGSGGFTKSGTGTITISGAGGASGTVTVNAGTLDTTNSAALGTSSVTLNGGTFAAIDFPGTRVKVVTQNFLTGTGTIILSRRGNFVAALDLESDFTNIVMGLDQYQENIWWKFRFKAGVGFRDLSGNSIKYWGPAS